MVKSVFGFFSIQLISKVSKQILLSGQVQSTK